MIPSLKLYFCTGYNLDSVIPNIQDNISGFLVLDMGKMTSKKIKSFFVNIHCKTHKKNGNEDARTKIATRYQF